MPVRFVAVGQGPQEAETRQLHDDLGLADRVILTGFRDDAVRVMGACDIFTLASKWEGLPVALMEALALGLPVVATEVGGVAEEMHDGVDALLVPPRDPVALADAIERVVTDPRLRERLARQPPRVPATSTCIVPSTASKPPTPSWPRKRPPSRGAERRHRRVVHSPRARTSVRRHPPIVRRSSSCAVRRSAGVTILASSSCSRGSTIRTRSARRTCGWQPTATRIVGLRAFMRWEFVRGGEVLHAVRAVDTATHPDYQGKGLFTAMTMHGLDVIKDDGIDFVFNTPNDKSRPGYLKMGWQEVGKLPVAIRVAGPRGAVRMARSRVASSHWPLDVALGEPVADVVVGAGRRRRIGAGPFHDRHEREHPLLRVALRRRLPRLPGRRRRRRPSRLSGASAWRRQGVGDARLAGARQLRRPIASPVACCERTGSITRSGSVRPMFATGSYRPRADRSSPGVRCAPKRCRRSRTGASAWATWSCSSGPNGEAMTTKEKIDQRSHPLQPSWTGSSHQDRFDAIRPLVEGRSVLDIGAGSGHWRETGFTC